MIEVVPAVLPKSFAELSEKVSSVAGLVSTVQLDVLDGVFVSEMSWPYQEGGVSAEFLQLQRGERSVPSLGKLQLEVDLMVAHPETVVDQWVAAGAKRIIVHIESVSAPREFFTNVQPIRDRGVEVGVAIAIETETSSLIPLLDLVDVVQCMGIAQIGYQGNPFDNRVLGKLAYLRQHAPEIILSVDGGVNLESAPKLISVGANRLVAGSAIFASANIPETIGAFQKLSTQNA